jgi:hypothetical protein
MPRDLEEKCLSRIPSQYRYSVAYPGSADWKSENWSLMNWLLSLSRFSAWSIRSSQHLNTANASYYII